jgi:GR25 family glycosyltransferase involved in LPS biosynthesis
MFQLPPLSDLVVHCINLERRPDRWASAQAQWHALGLPADHLCRVDAVDTNNFIGCARSHQKCAQLALDSGADFVFVVEDDVSFRDSFPDRYEALRLTLADAFQRDIDDSDTLLVESEGMSKLAIEDTPSAESTVSSGDIEKTTMAAADAAKSASASAAPALVLLGGASWIGTAEPEHLSGLRRLGEFSGLFCVMYSAAACSVLQQWTPADGNIDRWLGRRQDVERWLAIPFLASTTDGRSDLRWRNTLDSVVIDGVEEQCVRAAPGQALSRVWAGEKKMGSPKTNVSRAIAPAQAAAAQSLTGAQARALAHAGRKQQQPARSGAATVTAAAHIAHTGSAIHRPQNPVKSAAEKFQAQQQRRQPVPSKQAIAKRTVIPPTSSRRPGATLLPHTSTGSILAKMIKARQH